MASNGDIQSIFQHNYVNQFSLTRQLQTRQLKQWTRAWELFSLMHACVASLHITELHATAEGSRSRDKQTRKEVIQRASINRTTGLNGKFPRKIQRNNKTPNLLLVYRKDEF